MQLRLRGLSWLAVSRSLGVSPQAIQQAAAGRPSIPIERALADLLGVNAQELFAEHWTSKGLRIPHERSSLHKAKHSDSHPIRHVQKREVA
ncbi:helix-turn-helix domain-containing protein [Ancylobacter sp. A5.8]|uniref:helix-turn-helix domain-containing protein n=1 Tax=Ancylobacter gelatini TaxID=2919920 RepID=UPI001F4DAD9B|nr:helix-turn-helix domain-containing protein [Ancylobacter gelatini]MCJ8142926.1 helix-turn-helix domain-containing protein [Ancylobacter gelatini]